jgi:hypothetical protein
VDENGTIKDSDEQIIKEKVKTVFFSDTEIFALPYKLISVAQNTYEELKNQYPSRKMKIVGIESIDDLLNRRNLVDIRKQKAIVRTRKFIRKNWMSAAAAILLTILFTYFFAFDFDDNPYSASFDGSRVYIKNKNGKVLWNKQFESDQTPLESARYRESLVKVLDIDGDLKNEVILNQLPKSLYSPNYPYGVVCFSSLGEVKWVYILQDTVYSRREKLIPPYGIFLIDTLTFNGLKSLYVSGSNVESFSSGVFRIDLKTGKRLPGTLWSSGHITDGIIRDVNGDGKIDMLCVGLDNGFEDAVLFGYELDTLTTVRLSTEDYLINGYPIKSPITYIRFSKTDYDAYEHLRTPAPMRGSFYYDENTKAYKFYTADIFDKYSHAVWYLIKDNFKNIDVTIDNRFRVMRDSLVAHGKLPLPYTDTKEYKEIIKNNILYWYDNKWVNRKDLQ